MQETAKDRTSWFVLFLVLCSIEDERQQTKKKVEIIKKGHDWLLSLQKCPN